MVTWEQRSWLCKLWSSFTLEKLVCLKSCSLSYNHLLPCVKEMLYFGDNYCTIWNVSTTFCYITSGFVWQFWYLQRSWKILLQWHLFFFFSKLSKGSKYKITIQSLWVCFYTSLCLIYTSSFIYQIFPHFIIPSLNLYFIFLFWCYFLQSIF